VAAVPRAVVSRWTGRVGVRWMEQEAHWRWSGIELEGMGWDGMGWDGRDGQRDGQGKATLQIIA
jgi:hypothetical protein